MGSRNPDRRGKEQAGSQSMDRPRPIPRSGDGTEGSTAGGYRLMTSAAFSASRRRWWERQIFCSPANSWRFCSVRPCTVRMSVFQGGFLVAPAGLDGRSALVGRGVCRIEFDGAVEIGQRLVVPAQLRMGQPPEMVGTGPPRPEAERPVEIFQCFAGTFEPEQRGGPADAGRFHVRVPFDGGGEMGDAGFEISGRERMGAGFERFPRGSVFRRMRFRNILGHDGLSSFRLSGGIRTRVPGFRIPAKFRGSRHAAHRIPPESGR